MEVSANKDENRIDRWKARGTRLRRRLQIPVLVLLSSLLLLEGAARLAGEPPGSMREADDPAALHAQLLINGWVLNPGLDIDDCADYIENVLDGRTPDNASGEVEISPQGFRDTVLATPKPAEQIRILFIGDSSVYGAWICRLDTLAELLERGLNELVGDGLPGGHRKVEVINAGVPGYSSYQSLVELERAMDYGIDGVIVYSMISDKSGAPRLGDDVWFGRWAPFLRVLSHSAAVRWADYLVTPIVQESRNKARLASPGRNNRVHLRNYRDNLRRMAEEAHAAGAWIAFVIPPLSLDLELTFDRRGGGMGGSVITNARTAREQQGRLERRLEQVDGQDQIGFVIEDYRVAMALVAWENESVVINGPRVLRRAAVAGGEREIGKPESLMLDGVHPAPKGNQALARELVPRIADLL